MRHFKGGGREMKVSLRDDTGCSNIKGGMKE